MSNLYGHDAYRYDPPNFSLFKKWGHGFVWLATNEVLYLEISFKSADIWINRHEAGKLEADERVPDLLHMYAELASADVAIRSLKSMPKEELQKHVALDGPVDIDALEARFDNIFGCIRGWEKRQPRLIQEALDFQMEEQLKNWSKYLDWAEAKPGRPYVVDEDELMESISDFASERDGFEYFRLAMYRVRHIMIFEDMKSYDLTGQLAVGRLPDIKFEQFEKRLLELDERFRKVLGNRRADEPSFWTEPEFWWNHPPKKRSRQ